MNGQGLGALRKARLVLTGLSGGRSPAVWHRRFMHALHASWRVANEPGWMHRTTCADLNLQKDPFDSPALRQLTLQPGEVDETADTARPARSGNRNADEVRRMMKGHAPDDIGAVATSHRNRTILSMPSSSDSNVRPLSKDSPRAHQRKVSLSKLESWQDSASFAGTSALAHPSFPGTNRKIKDLLAIHSSRPLPTSLPLPNLERNGHVLQSIGNNILWRYHDRSLLSGPLLSKVPSLEKELMKIENVAQFNRAASLDLLHDRAFGAAGSEGERAMVRLAEAQGVTDKAKSLAGTPQRTKAHDAQSLPDIADVNYQGGLDPYNTDVTQPGWHAPASLPYLEVARAASRNALLPTLANPPRTEQHHPSAGSASLESAGEDLGALADKIKLILEEEARRFGIGL